ncbi:AMP-binding protein [Streptacidiphilus neutrinimicus]|uniref:AMP-binding protein n=1 Tax=Streptacidiphilus neutrinimicus TaxID=105420 RepID=UPI0005AB5D13|nr:AMP-binding protein [Streptacidiphilus neutrinimicus]
MIGTIDREILLAHARTIASRGGKAVPDGAKDLCDLEVCGPAEITAMTRAAAERDGSVLVSSGGTTGTPKLTYLPHHMAFDRLLPVWRPLGVGDVVLNLYDAGRMWGTHYFVQKLAERTESTVIPSGPMTAEELELRLPMLRDVGVSVLASVPSGLADFAEIVLKTGVKPPVKNIIWMGEAWTEAKRELVRQAFPDVRLWGIYGSVETWAMGSNGPDCDETTLHLLADEIFELEDSGALLTRVGEGWTVPVVRYRLGDRVEAAQCRCGRGDAFRVLGRADDGFSLLGNYVNTADIVDRARQCPGVVDAQLVLVRDPDTADAARSMTVEYTGTAAPEAVRSWLTGGHVRLGTTDSQHPEAISARRVDRLRRIARTNKTPGAVWQDPLDSAS